MPPALLTAVILCFSGLGAHAQTGSEITPSQQEFLNKQFEPELATDPVAGDPGEGTISPAQMQAAPLAGAAAPVIAPTSPAAQTEKDQNDSEGGKAALGLIQGLMSGVTGGGGGTSGRMESGDGMTERDSQETEGDYVDYSSTPDQAPKGYFKDPVGIEDDSPFVSAITEGAGLDVSGWKKNRGLVQVPTGKGNNSDGPCGSFHYRPDSEGGELVDNWANPTTACTFVAFLQEWKKANPGNQLQWGDISHKTDPGFGGTHKSHTQGECIDIRPINVSGNHGGTNFSSADYNQEKTQQLIRLAKRMGGKPIYFNDPASGGSYCAGHNDHVHICFNHDNAKVQNTCKNLKVSKEICGDL